MPAALPPPRSNPEQHLVALHEARVAHDARITRLEQSLDHEKRLAKLEEHLEALSARVDTTHGNENKLGELCQAIAELVAVLKQPTTREATVALPSGPTTMRVRETRG